MQHAYTNPSAMELGKHKVKPHDDEFDGMELVHKPGESVEHNHWQGSQLISAEKMCEEMYPWEIEKHFNHAVREGDMYFTQVALKIRPNLVHHLDDRLMSPLCYAIKYQNVTMQKLLVSRGANVNLRGHEGSKPIHVAATFNSKENLILLLAHRNIKIDCQDDKGQTALHVACRRNNIDIAKILLQNGADVFKKEKDGTTVLHQPARNGSLALCNLLIQHSNPSLVWITDNNGITPVTCASVEGQVEVLKAFLGTSTLNKRMPDNIAYQLNKPDNDGATCLHHATQNKSLISELQMQVLTIILEAGANINAQRNDGNTSLHIAASLGYEEVVSLLLLKGASSNMQDKKRRTPLHECALSNQPAIAKKLLTLGADVNASDNQFMTPLHWACRKGHLEIVSVLLEYFAKPNIHDVIMRIPLHWAVIGEHENILDCLLTFPNIFDVINLQDTYDRTALHYAAEQGNTQMVRKLLNYGADISLTDHEERRPSHLASRAGKLQCLEILIQAGQTANDNVHHRDKDENIAALLAAEEGHFDVFQYLCQVGADFAVKDEGGKNSLMLSAAKGHPDIVKYILDKDIDINITDMNRNTALHYAAKEGDSEAKCLQLLLEYGAQLFENNNKETPVDFAVLTNNNNALEVFFNEQYWKWTMSYRRHNGMTHMDILIKCAPDMAKRILDYSITTSSKDKIDKNYAIIYNFNYVDPGPDDPASVESRYLALNTMAAEKREDLLAHPLSRGLIQLKWHSFVKYFFSLDLFFYLFFLACLTAFVLDQQPMKPEELDATTGCRKITSGNLTSDGSRPKLTSVTIMLEKSIVTGVLSIRILIECVKLFHKKLQYFTNFETYYFLALYVVTFLFMYPPDSEPCLWNWEFGIASVILAWSLLIFMIENLPTTGIYSLMFQKVLVSLVKIIVMFLFFIVGFALAFYISMSKSVPFNTFKRSLLKTFDMTVGELEWVTYFVSESYGVFQTIVEVVFVIFVVMMPIALMNLLVGLAVGDIDGIRHDASLRLITIRINLLYELETNLPVSIQRYIFKPFFEVYPNVEHSVIYQFFQGTYAKDYNAYMLESRIQEQEDEANTKTSNRISNLENTITEMAIINKELLAEIKSLKSNN